MRLVVSSLIALVSTIVASLASMAMFLFSPSGHGGALVVRYWSRFFLWSCGIKLSVSVDPAVGKGPCLVVANHASMLDIMACGASIPVTFHFASRPFFFKVPILGWGMFLGRHLSIDPKNPRKAARTLRRIGERFERNLSVLLFPEGTRSADGSIGRYKRGPFLTAIQNGVPILPVHHTGTAACLPRGSLRLRTGAVNVVIGAPIPTTDLKPPDARALAERVEAWTRERNREAMPGA